MNNVADIIIANTVQLALEVEFADGDTRTITQDNPKDDITTADLEAFQRAASGVLIGDKASSPFSRLKQALRRTTVKTTMDFN